MNITLSADEGLIKKARAYARKNGTSLNQLIRDQMKRAVGSTGSAAADEFLQLTKTHAGRSPKGWRFNRDEAHTR